MQGHCGEAYRMLCKYQETFADLNKSLEIRLNDVFALKHRGEAYRMLCKY